MRLLCIKAYGIIELRYFILSRKKSGHISLQKYPLPDLISQRPKYYLNSFSHAKLYKTNNNPFIFSMLKGAESIESVAKGKG